MWPSFEIYHNIVLSFAVCLLLLIVYTVKQMESVVKFYHNGRHRRAEKMAHALRMLILVPELIGGAIALFVLLDPAGAFLLVDFYTARTLMNSRAVIVGSVDLVLICYCHDIHNTYKSGRSFRQHVPILVKHWRGLPVIVLSAATMITVDLIVSYFSLRGALAGSVNLVPVLYLLLVYLAGTVWLVTLTVKVGEEATTTINSMRNMEPALAEKLERTFLLKKYMMLSVLGRVANMLSFLAVATGWFVSSPFAYVVTFVVLIFGGSLLSSTAHILLAIEVTPSTTTVQPGSTVAATGIEDYRFHLFGHPVKQYPDPILSTLHPW